MPIGKIAEISISNIGKVSGVGQVSRKEINATALVSDGDLQNYFRLNNGALTTDSKNGYTLTNMNSVGNVSCLFEYGADLGSANTNKYLYKDSNFGVDDVTALSMSIWVLARNHPGSGASWDLFVRNCGKTGFNTNYVIRYIESGGKYYMRFVREKVGSTSTNLDIEFDLGTTAWHHLVLTWDGSTMCGYIDGNLKGSVAASGAPSGSSVSMGAIGVNRTRNANFASAYFDDAAYFKDALTATEIKMLNSDIGKVAGVFVV